eukprot:jgi/Mesvir1/22126/Mv18729-RA.1
MEVTRRDFVAPFPHNFWARVVLSEQLICVPDFVEGAMVGVSTKGYDAAVTPDKRVLVDGVELPFIKATTAIRMLAESSSEGLRARKLKGSAIADVFYGPTSTFVTEDIFVKSADTLVVAPPPRVSL